MRSKIYQKILWASLMLIWLTGCDNLLGITRGLGNFRFNLPHLIK